MVSDGVLIALIGVAGGLPTLAVKVMLNGSSARSKRIESKLDGHIETTSSEFTTLKECVGDVQQRVSFIEGSMERRNNPGRPTVR